MDFLGWLPFKEFVDLSEKYPCRLLCHHFVSSVILDSKPYTRQMVVECKFIFDTLSMASINCTDIHTHRLLKG